MSRTITYSVGDHIFAITKKGNVAWKVCKEMIENYECEIKSNSNEIQQLQQQNKQLINNTNLLQIQYNNLREKYNNNIQIEINRLNVELYTVKQQHYNFKQQYYDYKQNTNDYISRLSETINNLHRIIKGKDRTINELKHNVETDAVTVTEIDTATTAINYQHNVQATIHANQSISQQQFNNTQQTVLSQCNGMLSDYTATNLLYKPYVVLLVLGLMISLCSVMCDDDTMFVRVLCTGCCIMLVSLLVSRIDIFIKPVISVTRHMLYTTIEFYHIVKRFNASITSCMKAMINTTLTDSIRVVGYYIHIASPTDDADSTNDTGEL